MSKPRQTITPLHVSLIGFSFLFLLIGIQGVFFFRQKIRTEESRKWVIHTYDAMNGVRTLFAKIKDAELGQEGYLLSGQERFLEPYYAAINDPRASGLNRMGYHDTRSFVEIIASVRELTKDNGDQQKALARLTVLLQQKLTFIEKSLRANEQSKKAMLDMIHSPEAKGLMDEIRTLVTEMLDRERSLLDQRLKADQETEAKFSYFIVSSALLTYLSLLITILLIIRNSSRILQTERELGQKENHFRAVVENTVDLFFLFKAQRAVGSLQRELSLEYANPAAEKITGIVSNQLKNRRMNEVFSSFRPHLQAIEHSYFEILQSKIPREVEFTPSAGPALGFYYLEQAIPFDEGIAIIYRDITERKTMERMKNEFVSTVSHELRTPLTSIRGSLGLITGTMGGELSSQVKALLAIAYNNCERLVRLINDILDIEKIESGRMTFNCHPLPLLAELRQALEVNQGFADKFGVRLELPEESSLLAGRLEVVADHDRFIQILTNLISNAVKFSPKTESVILRCEEIDGFARISVQDKGPGIPPAFQNRIFQKFAQADSSDTRQKGGTGLGLSIVKSMVEEMKGKIGFSTEENRGTTFHFTVPLQAPKNLPMPSVSHCHDPKRPRILICEDEPDIANLLKMIMERTGFAADISFDTQTAMQFLATQKYQAMTLDLMLPDKSGVTFIRELRADPRFHDLPIVVVSAKAEEGRKSLNGDAIGILDWMVKPIDVEKIVRVVQKVRTTNARPRVLHVEDDHDIAEVLRLALIRVATVSRAATLQTARDLLGREMFDLVVLDVGLPDGRGTDLLPLLGSHGAHPTPVVLFSAQEAPPEISSQVAAALTKASTSEKKLFETIQTLISVGQPAETEEI